MEQLNLFNKINILDDGFKYDYQGKFVGIDIKKFSTWWDKQRLINKDYNDHIEKVLKDTREFIYETNNLIDSFKSRQILECGDIYD